MNARQYSTTRAAIARAERRVAERAAAVSLAGSFRSAQATRLRDRPVARIATPNAHRDQLTRDRLVQLTEDLCRNNIVAATLCDRKGEVVAGAEPGLRLASASDEWNGLAAAFIAAWGVDGFDHEGVLTFNQFAAFVVENAMRSGDGLLVLLEDGGCQWIDGVRVRNPFGAMDTATLVGGVRLDEYGRTLGYEVARWNERGDMLSSDTDFVDAADCLYVGGGRGRVAGQRRGEPMLASCFDRLEDMERLNEAVTKSAQMAAMLSVFIRSAHPDISPLDYGRGAGGAGGAHGEDTAAIARARDAGELLLRPGMVTELAPGEEIDTVNPSQPGSQYDRTMWAGLHLIAARVGLPLELGFYRYTNNYAAGRSAIVSAWKGITKEQRWLRDRVLTPVVRWRLAVAIDRGELPYADGWDRVGWKLPGIPTLDLGAEVDACVRGVAGGVMTREDAVDRVNDGLGIDEFYRARGIEIERERALGIETRLPSNITETTSQVTSVDADQLGDEQR